MSQSNPLPRATAESQGISSGAILDFVNAADEQVESLHSFMLLRHGKVVAEGWWGPYGADRPHLLFSLSKSFTSTAVGLAVSDGKLSVDDSVVSFFPDELPAKVSDRLKAMRVKHLLNMSCGHDRDVLSLLRESANGNWVRRFFELPVVYEPGTHWVYNGGGTYMLSAIVTKLAGKRMLDYLSERVLDALGIERLNWLTCPRGIDIGAGELSAKTEDIARFGQLYLQKGKWNGKQLVPSAWIEEATAKSIDNDGTPPDWHQGYGYQFWRCRHNNYRGDGAFGQYCVVMPQQDAVVAMTGGMAQNKLQGPLDLIWKHLLPAMGKAALPADNAGNRVLVDKCKSLRMRPISGKSHSAIEKQISGKTFRIDSAEKDWRSVRFDFANSSCTITIGGDRGEQRIQCGYDSWVEGNIDFDPSGHRQIAASYAWTDEKTLVCRMCLTETSYNRTFRFAFEGGSVGIERAINVSFGAVEAGKLIGMSGAA